jgi:hypothetical protein
LVPVFWGVFGKGKMEKIISSSDLGFGNVFFKGVGRPVLFKIPLDTIPKSI